MKVCSQTDSDMYSSVSLYSVISFSVCSQHVTNFFVGDSIAHLNRFFFIYLELFIIPCFQFLPIICVTQSVVVSRLHFTHYLLIYTNIIKICLLVCIDQAPKILDQFKEIFYRLEATLSPANICYIILCQISKCQGQTLVKYIVVQYNYVNGMSCL